ncbi:ATP-binding cassette transporter [Clonorchis sinensis]|uniref:ATP-binding cassette transporter n=1 Tax=Clonorchis sinensis TaxID=79923 RepID=G7YX88_CLOSI|nr:ATP-binding cassette transporter [Clonorchis sinensis]
MHTRTVLRCIIIIIDSVTSVFNTDASLPYNHGLFESLIVKKRIKMDGEGTYCCLTTIIPMCVNLQTLIQAIWIETDNKIATDIGWQPYLATSRKLERSMPIQYLRRSTIAQQYRSELAQQLSKCTGSENADEAWQSVKGAMLAAFNAVCPTSPIRPQNHWISARSLFMIDAQKSIPAGNAYDGARKSLQRQIVKSLRKDLELWSARETDIEILVDDKNRSAVVPFRCLTAMPPEGCMDDKNAQVGRISPEETQLGGRFEVHAQRTDSHKHWISSRSADLNQSVVSETICENEGKTIHSQNRRLERWAEHFKEQSSWNPSTQPVEEPSGPE